MSTKIYYAYRLPKSKDILSELKKCKNIATQMVSEDAQYLEMLHGVFMWDIAKKLKNEPENECYKNIKQENINGEFRNHFYDFITFLENNSTNKLRENFSGKFECSVFYDNDYWYIKFFPNESVQYKMVDKFEEELKLEDFHYQNQTDVPENITEEEYDYRCKKWDELTESSGGDYTDGFIYEVMNANQIKKMLSEYFYTGKPLFDHLAYKFDKVFFKENIVENNDNI